MHLYPRLLILSVFLVFVSAATAETTVFFGITYDVVISAPMPVGDGTESLRAFTLAIVNTTGNAMLNPAGFDGTALFGYTGISGKLHQQDVASLIRTPTTDNTDLATDIDTHFLFTMADVLAVTAPVETSGLLASGEAPNATGPLAAFAQTSFGDNLTGDPALIGGATGPRWDLAYIVVPQGELITLDFVINGFDGSEDIFASFEVVPEPTSLSLLSIGAILAMKGRPKLPSL